MTIFLQIIQILLAIGQLVILWLIATTITEAVKEAFPQMFAVPEEKAALSPDPVERELSLDSYGPDFDPDQFAREASKRIVDRANRGQYAG